MKTTTLKKFLKIQPDLEVHPPVSFHLSPASRFMLAFTLMLSLLSTPALAADSLPSLIQSGEREQALELIRVGADVNERQGDGSTALLWASYNVDNELAQALLAREADPNIVNNYGSSALAEAVKAANVDLVKMLLAAGADAEAPNADGQTTLMLAARTGVVEVAELLIAAGANVNVLEQWRGQTPLMWAASNNHFELTALLLEHGAQVDVRAGVFDWGSQITAEPRAQYRPAGGLTALLYAARTGCTQCAEALLTAGADVNKPSPDGVTPLMIAIDNSHFDTAKLLLEQGANPHVWDVWGRTALYIAIDMNSYGGRPAPFGSVENENPTALDIARMLLEVGVNVDPQLSIHRPGRGGNSGRFTDDPLTTGATPLLRAATSHDVAALNLLLEFGASIELANVMGVTPFMAAAGFGNRRSVLRGTYEEGREDKVIPALEVLIDAGADINGKISDTTSHNARIARMSTMTDRQGQTPLFAATKQNWTTVVTWLIEHGAEITVVDDQGKTVMDAALGNSAGGRSDRAVSDEMVALIEGLLNN